MQSISSVSNFVVSQLLVLAIVFFAPKTAVASIATDEACRQASEAKMHSIDPTVGNRVTNLSRSSLQPISRPASTIRNAKNIYLIYNYSGEICFQSHRRVKQGDILNVAVYGNSLSLATLRRFVLQCESESSDLRLVDTLGTNVFPSQSLDGRETDSTRSDFYWFATQECFGDVVRFELRDSSNNLEFGKTISQYPRFTGSYQLGTVWTSLHNQSFSRAMIDGVSTIVASGDSGTGPIYIGSLVIYGLPHYISSIGKDFHYAGRDIVNESGWMDSLGMVLSIGLEDPADTFGVGLSFEFARGLAITGSYLSRKTDQLVGLSVGDEFAPTAGDIPIRSRWKSDFVIGLSIDGRYLSKFF